MLTSWIGGDEWFGFRLRLLFDLHVSVVEEDEGDQSQSEAETEGENDKADDGALLWFVGLI